MRSSSPLSFAGVFGKQTSENLCEGRDLIDQGLAANVHAYMLEQQFGAAHLAGKLGVPVAQGFKVGEALAGLVELLAKLMLV
jgi:hypothetical protein